MRSRSRARRGMRVLASVCTVAVGVGVLGAATVPASAASPAKKSKIVSRSGAEWLATQIVANGGHINSFGSPDPTNTAYAVVGLHAAQVGAKASKRAIKYLKGQLGAALQTGGADAPGALGYYIMAAVSAGTNPRHFGGHGAAHDLVARLLATQRTTGPTGGCSDRRTRPSTAPSVKESR